MFQGVEFSILFIQRRVEAVRTFSPKQCVQQKLDWVRSQAAAGFMPEGGTMCEASLVGGRPLGSSSDLFPTFWMRTTRLRTGEAVSLPVFAVSTGVAKGRYDKRGRLP